MGPAIAIGANIYRHRKEFHLTQDESRFERIIEGLRELAR